MSNKTDILLSVRNLTIEFIADKKAVPIVEGINFDLQKGEVFSLAGESGSGKTVTTLSICGLLSRNARISGSITFYDQGVSYELTAPREAQRMRGRQIGYIFQQPQASLNPLIRVGYQISEVFLFHRIYSSTEAKSATLKLFTEMAFDDPERIFYSYPHQLSGGQAQRVMIAQALALSPKLLIADEPTAHLDVTTEMEIMKILKKLNREKNISILFITHDLTLVEYISNRVAILCCHKILETFPAQEVFTATHHAYTNQFIEACVRL